MIISYLTIWSFFILLYDYFLNYFMIISYITIWSFPVFLQDHFSYYSWNHFFYYITWSFPVFYIWLFHIFLCDHFLYVYMIILILKYDYFLYFYTLISHILSDYFLYFFIIISYITIWSYMVISQITACLFLILLCYPFLYLHMIMPYLLHEIWMVHRSMLLI